MERAAREDRGKTVRIWFSIVGLLLAVVPAVVVLVAGILEQRPAVSEIVTRALVMLGFLGPLATLPFVLYLAALRSRAVSVGGGTALLLLAAGLWIAWYPVRREEWTSGALVAIPLALLAASLLLIVVDRLVLRAAGSPVAQGAAH